MDRIRELEADLEREVAAAQERWHYRVESGKVWFEAGVRRHHRRMRTSLGRYCSYANGLLAYVREVAARTEQYWCPIKHAQRVRAPHSRYRYFVDYGDAEGYKRDCRCCAKR